MMESRESEGIVVLFDGVCNLCNGAVQFIIRRDKRGRFCFASLQSDVGQGLLRGHGVAPHGLYSMIVVEDGVLYERSDAALRIARRLPGLWPVLGVFGVLPRRMRDGLYNFVAKNRYRWFGKRDVCMMPDPALRGRFLS